MNTNEHTTLFSLICLKMVLNKFCPHLIPWTWRYFKTPLKFQDPVHQNSKYTRTDWDKWTWRQNSLSLCWLVWQLCWRSSIEKVYWLVTDWPTNAKILPLRCGCWIAGSVLGEHIFWPLILLLHTLFGRMVCAWNGYTHVACWEMNFKHTRKFMPSFPFHTYGVQQCAALR